jgi:hypothetical protein
MLTVLLLVSLGGAPLDLAPTAGVELGAGLNTTTAATMELTVRIFGGLNLWHPIPDGFKVTALGGQVLLNGTFASGRSVFEPQLGLFVGRGDSDVLSVSGAVRVGPVVDSFGVRGLVASADLVFFQTFGLGLAVRTHGVQPLVCLGVNLDLVMVVKFLFSLQLMRVS